MTYEGRSVRGSRKVVFFLRENQRETSSSSFFLWILRRAEWKERRNWGLKTN